ncbi:hypothetical protein F4818DRAFT_13819 [Hypoxylon cercidicola]|nr:hypothetical protein F4818DRAFT_13819 [Hypoxylon cercidicola]
MTGIVLLQSTNHEIASAQPYRSTSTLEVHGDTGEPADQLEHNIQSKIDKQDSDVSDHHQIQGPSPFSCAECNSQFPDLTTLEEHIQVQRHRRFKCSCGKNFSRTDPLKRHCASYRKDTEKFSCTFCKRHRGKHGFTRRDHLVQHLSSYHKFDPEEVEKICPTNTFKFQKAFVCPHPGCEFNRYDGKRYIEWSELHTQKYLAKQSDYSKHMKDTHDESPFPCREAGCERVGAKGYTRERDLIKHLAKQHPYASKYSPMPHQETPKYRYIKFDCTQCNDYYFVSPKALGNHIQTKHGNQL